MDKLTIFLDHRFIITLVAILTIAVYLHLHSCNCDGVISRECRSHCQFERWFWMDNL